MDIIDVHSYKTQGSCLMRAAHSVAANLYANDVPTVCHDPVVASSSTTPWQPSLRFPHNAPSPSLRQVNGTRTLPLRLLQHRNNLLQRRQPLLQLSLHLALVVTQLLVEVLAVWGGAHGGAEERLDNKGVVGLECVAVGAAEGVGELGGGVRDVVAEALGCEVEATGEEVLVTVSWKNGG
jgi:hypothetical protein